MTGRAPGISLVIPTFNEEENLRQLLPTLPSFVEELIVVDSHSSDRTTEVAASFGAKVIFERGAKGRALRRGLAEAAKDIVITMDADCSHRPEELSRFVETLLSGCDLVIGSRFKASGKSDDVSLLRRIGNWVHTRLVNRCWKTNYTDVNYGFRAFRKTSLPKLKLTADDFDIEVEICIHAAKAKLKTLEVPCYEKKRAFGRGKLLTFRDGWIILLKIFKELLRP